ncbi:MAG: hypothetical protein LAP38_14340 [Acidobacteriia bacterium]|nr:hypothetical protein [Terriglobia bacterium]
MKSNVKTELPEATARAVTPISLFTEWVQQGTETFFATQRILLDLVMRQNAMAMNTIRERFTAMRPTAANALTEMAGEGMTNFIAAQKILLDLAKKQNDIVLSGVKERVGISAPAAAMSDLLRRSVDTFIDLQRHFLDVAAKQTGAWVESAKTGKTFTGEGLAELAREGMENFVAAQKKFLDVVAEEAAKAAKPRVGTAKAEKPTELAELARESVDAFIDAQKRLLDTAGEQIRANTKVAGRAMGLFTPVPGTNLADLTRQGVESFVAAQKALLDVMTRPRPAAPLHAAAHPVVHAKARPASRRVHVH